MLYKPEDLIWMPSTKLDALVYTITSELKRLEIGGSLELAGQPAILAKFELQVQ